jgi:hypothetical protein
LVRSGNRIGLLVGAIKVVARRDERGYVTLRVIAKRAVSQ